MWVTPAMSPITALGSLAGLLTLALSVLHGG